MCVLVLYILCVSVYSVVEYASHDDLKKALRKLDGADLNGRKMRLIEERPGSSRHRRSFISLLISFPVHVHM